MHDARMSYYNRKDTKRGSFGETLKKKGPGSLFGEVKVKNLHFVMSREYIYTAGLMRRTLGCPTTLEKTLKGVLLGRD